MTVLILKKQRHVGKILENESDSVLVLRRLEKSCTVNMTVFTPPHTVFTLPPLVWEENQLIICDTTVFAMYTV